MFRFESIDRGKTPSAAELTKGLRKAMSDTVNEGKRFMAEYPPQKPTLRGRYSRRGGYRRTGTLKRSWSAATRVTGTRIEGEIGSSGNIAPYNVFVQGPDNLRTRYFRNSDWQSVEDLTKTVEADLTANVEKEFNGILKRTV